MSQIYVLSGTNGAGKSSIAGAAFREFGGEYFNPDEVARNLRSDNSNLTQAEANGSAWQVGVRLLQQAIHKHLHFAFETTLGGGTIPRLLMKAASQGIHIHVWYIGLATPDLHIERVQARVRHGGHAISEQDIHRRFEQSRLNLIALLPHMTSLRMFDNSAPGDPLLGQAPIPQLILHLEQGKILAPTDLTNTPNWAKPIVASAIKLQKK